jgi:hypothetical protein
MSEIRSNRPDGPLQVIYAFVVELADGAEGVVRRDTPIGTQPIITDSLATAELLRPLAEYEVRRMRGVGMLKLAKFVREK